MHRAGLALGHCATIARSDGSTLRPAPNHYRSSPGFVGGYLPQAAAKIEN